MSNYPQVVEQIHHEFNTAGERLLQESLGIIEFAERVDAIKAYRLNSVGFIKNPIVSKTKHIEELVKTPKQLASFVMKYKATFPNNKFIADFDVMKICEKYHLVHGDIEQYKGFVPEKNLSDIENFLKNRGLNNKYIVSNVNFPYTASQGIGIRRVKKYLKKVNSTLMADSERGAEQFLKNEIGGMTGNGITSLSATFIKKSPFTICAPKRDMDDKSFFSKILPFGTTFTNINPDPVVLYPVECGYLIVTAWGDEASDPIVVNEQMN